MLKPASFFEINDRNVPGIETTRGGINLEYGNLENWYLEGLFISKKGVTGISKKSNGNLEINLKKCIRN